MKDVKGHFDGRTPPAKVRTKSSVREVKVLRSESIASPETKGGSLPLPKFCSVVTDGKGDVSTTIHAHQRWPIRYRLAERDVCS